MVHDGEMSAPVDARPRLPRFVLRSRRVLRYANSAPEPAAVVVEDDRIAAILDADSVQAELPVVDAGDAVVMPGVVDTHAHVNEPGRTEWEGFETATRAAAAGGVTTLVDMPLNSIPPTTTRAGLEAKLAAARGACRVDYAFWGGLVPGNAGELAPLVDAGVLGFKAFLIESGVPEFQRAGEADLREGMRILARLGVPLLVHAELDLGCAGIVDGGDASRYATYLASRPAKWEVDAIRLVVRLVRETGCPAHIVHLSAAAALPVIAEARDAGLPLTVETCPHYLTLAADDVPDGATHFKCAPPIRERANQERLWEALARGVIDCIVSDHSPCTPALKRLESGDFHAAWGGIAGLQLALPVVWTEARRRGRSLADVARWMCAEPARVAGLVPRKGVLAPGADADFVVWDPEATFAAGEGLQHRHALTPYAGRTLYGAVRQTYVRGSCVYDAGRFGGAPAGTWLRRTNAGGGAMTAPQPPFTERIDLASRRLGGRALAATDEFFAPKENLLEPGPATFVAHAYTDRGKWMDGWESRRKRVPGHDWCVVKLGAPGVVHGVNVDTAHFVGNFPPWCWVEAAALDADAAARLEALDPRAPAGPPWPLAADPDPHALAAWDALAWTEILPRRRLRGGTENLFPVENRERWTHLRLHVEPDGGVARLRVHGVVAPDWDALRAGAGRIDLAAALHGGTVVACNDMFFGPKENLLMPERGTSMADGWETRRRREPGNDWIVVALGRAGRVRRIEVDTAHFKGNFPESCSVEGVRAGSLSPAQVRDGTNVAWEPLLDRTKLQADHVHVFEIAGPGAERIVDHVRLSIYPDGGVSRLRVFAEIA